jgi:hypothetical protein
MRPAILAAVILLAAAGAARAQVCTTSTTVVSRGPDVVSSNTSTRCEAGAPAAAAAEPAPAPPACTQTTTVVRRLDVVVSSNTSMKCEEPGGGGGGGIGVPKAVFAAPGGAASFLGKVLGGGPGDELTPANARGDWHVLDAQARRVCMLYLTGQADPAGLQLRKRDCSGALETATAWAVDGEAVVFRAKGGAEVVRFTGTREHMEGTASDGKHVVLGR